MKIDVDVIIKERLCVKSKQVQEGRSVSGVNSADKDLHTVSISDKCDGKVAMLTSVWHASDHKLSTEGAQM